jgi:hypothetical protein
VSFAVLFLTGRIAVAGYVLWDFDAHVTMHLPRFMVWNQTLYLPWQMVLYLSSGLVAGVVVSWLTRPVAREKLERFYALLRTPVQAGEQVDAPCTLPAGAVVPERRSVFGDSNVEIPVPSLTGVAGFAAGWGCVAAIVVVVYFISKM